MDKHVNIYRIENANYIAVRKTQYITITSIIIKFNCDDVCIRTESNFTMNEVEKNQKETASSVKVCLRIPLVAPPSGQILNIFAKHYGHHISYIIFTKYWIFMQ